jgi:ribosomal protein L11 methyltransferase
MPLFFLFIIFDKRKSTFAKKINMSNIYIGYHFTVEPKRVGSEILIAELEKLLLKVLLKQKTGISAFVQGLMGQTILENIQYYNLKNLKSNILSN